MKFQYRDRLHPHRARRLVGLPDLEPLHDIYLDRVKELMAKGSPRHGPADGQNWVPMGERVDSFNRCLSVCGGLMGGVTNRAESQMGRRRQPVRGRKSWNQRV